MYECLPWAAIRKGNKAGPCELAHSKNCSELEPETKRLA
jgi:hypothetical protein